MNYRRVMVFAAHPDDELVMAPAMAKMASLGVDVVIALMTDGCEGYPDPSMQDTIVELRRQEAIEADKVMGTRRISFDYPDMGLTNDKATFLRVLAAIRAERPDALFTHGPVETHRDHLNTSLISMEAVWQAGEPVSAALGEPWVTPHVWFYKNVGNRPPDLVWDVTGFAHVRQLTLATQVSQHVLFRSNRANFEAEAERIKAANAPVSQHFWFTGRTPLRGFPDV